MKKHYPLSDQPQFCVLEYPGYREYRVENWSPKSASSFQGQTFSFPLVLPVFFAILWQTVSSQTLAFPLIPLKHRKVPWTWTLVILLAYIAHVLKTKVFGILHGKWFNNYNNLLGANFNPESVIILPPHGIQLETHRGFLKGWPLQTTRRFIPSSVVSGIVINEGLRGWNVLFYLVVVKSEPLNGSSLEVAYQVSRHDYMIGTMLKPLFSRTYSHATLYFCKYSRVYTKSYSAVL